MRDQNKDAAYWDFYLQDRTAFMGEVAADLETAPKTYNGQVADLAYLESFAFNLTCASYSAGASVEDCMLWARALLIEHYPAYVAACGYAPARAQKEEAGGFDMRTRYLALAVLCRLSPQEAKPLVDSLDFWPDRDGLWEEFIEFLGHGNGRPEQKALLWPTAYALALETLDRDGTDLTRQAALARFDKGWLKVMRGSGNPFYSNLKNKNNTYVGYWNFEAAALAVMRNIDDSQLAKSDTYPADWVGWARRP